ncbi:MAG: hypothetical protein EOP09_19290, partial [Proteobacteria bacterium]
MKNKILCLKLLMLQAAFLSFGSTVVAQGMSPADTLTRLFDTLPPCDLVDVTSDGVLAEMGKPDKVVTPEWLGLVYDHSAQYFPIPFLKERSKLRSENPYPQNENEYTFWPKNDRTRHLVQRIAQHLQTSNGAAIPLAELTSLADAALSRAKADGMVGECYKVSQVSGSWNTEWTSNESLSPKVQATIDQLFTRGLTQNSDLTS